MSVTERDAGATQIRVDRKTGVREELGYIGTGSRRMLSTLHRPPGEARGAMVVCCSLLSDLQANYSNEVQIARAAAAQGVAVRRFHYLGIGHSDGDIEDRNYEQMVGGAEEVAAHLRSEVGADRVSFLGTRVGAMVAAGAAARYPGAPLVLWEPIVKGAAYFKEAFRAIRIRDASNVAASKSRDERIAEIMAGHTDVLGYAVGRPLYESFKDLDLAELLDDSPRAVWLVQISQRRQIRPDYEALMQRQRATGSSVEYTQVGEDFSWWFPKRAARMPASEKLVRLTAAWIGKQFAAGGKR